MNIVEVKDQDYKSIIDKLLKRGIDDYSDVDNKVANIIDDIKKTGDEALYKFTSKFDGVDLDSLRVTDDEIKKALEIVGNDFIEILKEAKQNISDYHSKQVQNSWITEEREGVVLGQLIRPLERVGIYVPGGTAAYPSTVLMNSIPAKIAGVKSIAMVTPPNKEGKVNPFILAAAYVANVDEIYKVGGAQSVAALAYGTETIVPVNKIVGPGNIYVARAKRAVFGLVDIDMIAGPSEICIIAEENKNPKYIAADLLSQAEHDEMASAVLVTSSRELAEKVQEELKMQTKKLNRGKIIEKSLSNYSYAFIVEDIYKAIELSNEIAPEHLELMVDNPLDYISYIKNAGALFLGEYTPEPVGDYFAGPNHTLPTSGTAKFSSPLGVYDFVKKSSLLYYNRLSLGKIKDKVATFARAEGLDAHANSVEVRF